MMKDKEPVWMSHKEDYAFRLLKELQMTMMPTNWVTKQFDRLMEEYDREHESDSKDQ